MAIIIGIIVLIVIIWLFVAFPEVMVFILFAIVVVLFLLWANNKKNAELENAELAKVWLSVSYDLVACTKKFPLRITTSNKTENAIHKVTFGLTGHREGYSSKIYDTVLSSDKIVKSAQTWSQCWAVPKRDRYQYSGHVPPSNEIVWTIKLYDVEFRR